MRAGDNRQSVSTESSEFLRGVIRYHEPWQSTGGPLKYSKMNVMLLFDRIAWNPNQMNGQPCVRGMRLTVRRVVEAVALYPNRDDLFRNYPELPHPR
jgi:uncharacterized protein (DUF433 family)